MFVFVILSCLCGHLLGKCCPLGSLEYDVYLCLVTFPYCVLDQVWNMIVLIPDLCLHSYFVTGRPQGWGRTLIFSYIRRLGRFFLVQILNFNIFWGFSVSLAVAQWRIL